MGGGRVGGGRVGGEGWEGMESLGAVHAPSSSLH